MRRRMNDPCWCGSGRKLKRCHLDRRTLQYRPIRVGNVTAPREVPAEICRPPYARTPPGTQDTSPQVLGVAAQQRMSTAGRVAAEVLAETVAAVAIGVTTEELDQVAHDAYVRRGAYPSTLHYKGFTKSVCTSVNEVICHGVPDDRALRDGDIVNVDVTAYIEGMHGDTSATVVVGGGSPAIEALLDVTRRATMSGIAAIRPGAPLSVIAEAIVEVADEHGYGIVEEYGGHGIGEVFHAAPHVGHTVQRGDDTVLVPGMCITVEPMLTTGADTYRTAADGWTEILVDPMPSAQFEHTVLVTDDGARIMTLLADGSSALDRSAPA